MISRCHPEGASKLWPFLVWISFSNVMHDVRSLPSFPLRNCGVWCTKHKNCIYKCKLEADEHFYCQWSAFNLSMITGSRAEVSNFVCPSNPVFNQEIKSGPRRGPYHENLFLSWYIAAFQNHITAHHLITSCGGFRDKVEADRRVYQLLEVVYS